jgi:hypothetical protein
MRRLILRACCAMLLSGSALLAQAEEPVKATVCQIKADPASYNHELVEVEGFVAHGFEDLSLSDPACPDWPEIWLEYGGTKSSDTMYCCGITPRTTRPKGLTVEGIPVSLVDDEVFKAFNREIQPPLRSGKYGSIVRATLIGRFYAGRKESYPNGSTEWKGYGHMGCCSLLAIQQVQSVTPQDRDDLDYGESPDQPDTDKVGCGYQYMTGIWPWQEEIKAQQQAEQDSDSRAFDSPEHVAADFLVRRLKLDVGQPVPLAQKRKAQGRVVYEWNPAGRAHSYMVVVSKPFLLSFYARDPKRVAWVVIAAYDSSCDESKTVTRIK